MRRFYQESWQGIPFTAFSHISFFHLAQPRFYSIFYEELFKRYKNWNDLPAEWRKNKEKDAQWLATQIKSLKRTNPDLPPRVLSIGSGVGYMEKTLLELMPDIQLFINEPSTVGMKWIRQLVPADRIFIGMPTACLPADAIFDVVYLSAVDYGIPNRQLLKMLDELRAQLAPQGEIICISASLLEEDSFIGSLVNAMKIVIRGFLHFISLRRQQFWGWRRTRKEYKNLFKNAGFAGVEDGFLDDGFESYWIKGFESISENMDESSKNPMPDTADKAEAEKNV